MADLLADFPRSGRHRVSDRPYHRTGDDAAARRDVPRRRRRAAAARHRGSRGLLSGSRRGQSKRMAPHQSSSHRHLRHGDGARWRRCSSARARRPWLGSGRLPADERLPRGRRHSGLQRLPRRADHLAISTSWSSATPSRAAIPSSRRCSIERFAIWSLPEAIREHFLWGARSIVIAGTHGKTTTTALTGWVLTHGGADPERAGRRHRPQLRRSRIELSRRRRPRVRHRGRRVRQRLLRQDREVSEVPAGHRGRQQRRVRSRGHLRGPRRRCGWRSAGW